MIPESAIIEWRNTVPWSEDSQVEQDLIICRSLTAIYNDEIQGTCLVPVRLLVL